MEKTITSRQKELLSIIYNHIKNSGYPPSFEEMRHALKVSSNQSIIDLLTKLEKGKFLRRDESLARGLIILPLGYEMLNKLPLAPLAGTTTAGLPMESFELDGQWETLSPDVSKYSGETFLLKIRGDSMINAGIDNGDVVLVKSEKEFISGDIVLADLAGESTIKRFISDDKPPYVYLKPENPKYQIIPVNDEMRLIGKVISVIKNGYWEKVNKKGVYANN